MIFGLPIFVIVAAITVVYLYVDPAPPNTLVIATGETGGNYFEYAKEYQKLIEAEGVKLKIQPSNGAWDNLKQLDDPHSGVDIAFVQDGLGSRQKNPGLTSLGSMFYEPIWIFYRGPKTLHRLTQLKGKTVVIGEMGGETHTMAKKLLKASGLDESNTVLLPMDLDDEFAALEKGQADAGFFIGTPDNEDIQELLRNPKLKVMSLDQAEAITRQIPYLHHLVMPHGTVDLANNLPSEDVDLVSPTATLVVRDTIHPALVYLLLKAATRVHRGPGVFEKRHEFPSDKDYVFHLNTGAKNFYQSGAPFWLRYLPFWLATLIERFIYLVIPMLALVVPVLRSIPKFIQWRVRTRIYQRYGELKFLETKIRSEATREKYEQYLEQLDHIEDRVNHMRVPLDFSDYLYSLRGHIHFVRERLHQLINKKNTSLNL
jgi:TRAP transporter TAXI family solute receptor